MESPVRRRRPLQQGAGARTLHGALRRVPGGGGAARRGARKGELSFSLAPGGASLRDGKAVFFAESPPEPKCLCCRPPAPCPRRLRRAAFGPDSRSCPRSRASPWQIVERRCSSASAPPRFVPERPGWERQGAQNHPRLHGARAIGPGVALRVPPSLEGIVRAWAEIETKAHSQWVRLQFPPPRPQFKKNKMKTKRRPDASAPPARGGAASPRRRNPDFPAGAHFSAFNETFEASLRGRACPRTNGTAAPEPARGEPAPALKL